MKYMRHTSGISVVACWNSLSDISEEYTALEKQWGSLLLGIVETTRKLERRLG